MINLSLKQEVSETQQPDRNIDGGGESKDTIPVPKTIPKTAVTCELCGKIFSYFEHLRKHLIICRGNVGVQCQYCKHIFASFTMYQTHLDKCPEDYEM